MAGIESSANTRSTKPIAMTQRRSGVTKRLPSIFVVKRSPTKSSWTGRMRRAMRTNMLSAALPPWSPFSCWYASTNSSAPKM